MEVVWGIRPRLPQTLAADLPVQDIGIDQYTKELVDALKRTWKSVQDAGREIAQKRETETASGRGAPLKAGDLALRIFLKEAKPSGSRRFLNRYDGHIYRVRQVVGSNTYTLETLRGEVLKDNSNQDLKVSGEELVRVEVPALEFGLDEHQTTRLEIQSEQDHNEWLRATSNGVTPEGKVFLRFDTDPRANRLVDLTTLAYRWLYGEPGAPGAAIQGPLGPEVVAAPVSTRSSSR